ncbi:MAG: flippase-like domain-containing protein [Calditrichaeota bacterium]|nr:flippase-like domain-containing protein [Calditrichota bacterium]MCB9366464.1 flippase-like domain-containing protein [Calditrichota bacterium]MCB9391278.1 flippase-like domain-containing protein [Calditrichota bacterium]
MSVPVSDYGMGNLANGSGWKRHVAFFLKVSLSLALLYLLYRRLDWKGISNGLSFVGGRELLAVILLWIPNQYLQYLRWKLLAKRAGENVLESDIRASYWLGHTLGFITPGRVGAYGRGLFLTNVPLGKASVLTVAERLYSAITVNGFGLIALGILPYLGWKTEWLFWSGGVSILLSLLGTLLLCVGLVPGRIAKLIRGVLQIRVRAAGLVTSLEAAQGIQTRSAALYLFLAIASLLVSLLQFILMLGALGVEVPLLAGLLAVHLNFFLKGNIPLTLGSLGVGEWTAMLCLRGLGVPDSQAIAASLLLFALNVALPAAIGLIHVKRIFALPRQWRSRS